jgi:hypothetical protein
VKKLRSFEKQKLLLGELALKVEYQCKLNNGDNKEKTLNMVIPVKGIFTFVVENGKIFPKRTHWLYVLFQEKDTYFIQYMVQIRVGSIFIDK